MVRIVTKEGRNAMNQMDWHKCVRLFARANEEKLRLDRHPVLADTALVRSVKHPGVIYVVDEYRCTCPARGQCKHRALFAFNWPGMLLRIVDPETLPGVEKEADSA